ncbi:MAG: energy transducer TonB [Pseudomonadota bacterium]
MHFSHMNDGSGSKVTKIAAVAVFHVVLAMLLIQSMNARMISMPTLPKDVVLLFTPELTPPPPAPEPPRPMPKVAPPQIIAPPPEVEVTQTPPLDSVAAIVAADPAPPAPTAPSQAEAPPAPAASNANPGTMRTAVLADADGCARPDYPAKAVRNNESGTVTLALLVGTDGRVAGSRVQSSSGSRELDKAAVAALSMCKFKPATNGGVAEQAWAQIAYVWKLD